MIATGKVLWPMDMRLFISYCYNVTFLAGCLIDDRDSRAVWPMNMRMLISYFHEMILLVSCSIDRDRRSVMANERENTDQLLSQRDSLDTLID